MAFTSAEDLGGSATTDQDAFSETGETGYTDYSSYDSPNQSSGPSGGGLLGGGNFFSRKMQGVDPRYSHLTTVQDMYDRGWSKEHLNAAGAKILENRDKRSYLDKATEQYRGIGAEDAEGMNWRQWEQYQQIPVSPVDFSRPPTGPNPNFRTIVKPISSYQMPQSTRNNIAGIINQDYTGAQGEQYADNAVRSWVFDKLDVTDPKIAIDAWRKGVRSDIGDAFKTGIGAVGDVVGNWWDNMNADDANKVDPVEDFEALAQTPTQPTENPYLTSANIKKYNDIMKQDKARGTDTLYNQGPQGAGGTSFSPNRWNDIAKAANAQASASQSNVPPNIARAFNAKPNMANARQVAHSGQMATDALTYEDRQAMTDKQIVELINNRGATSTIHAKSYEPYGEPGVVTMFGIPMGEEQDSYKPIYSDKDENLINLFRMKGFDAEDFRIYPQQQQNIKGGGQTSLGLPGSFKDEPLLSVTPGIDLMGAGIVGLGSALAKFGTKSVGEFVSKFGKDSFDMLKGMLSKSNETNLSKLANSPINRSDDILTVTEQGLMKPVMQDKFGLGKHQVDDIGTISTKTPIQGENVFTNSQILSNRNRLNAKSIPVSARKANRRGRK